jgi:hypothetical protein
MKSCRTEPWRDSTSRLSRLCGRDDTTRPRRHHGEAKDFLSIFIAFVSAEFSRKFCSEFSQKERKRQEKKV